MRSPGPENKSPGSPRRLICQVYEMDPLICQRCSGTIRVIATRPSLAEAFG